MAVRQMPLTAATDAIDVDDLFLTVNTETGAVILEARTAQQLREYFSGEADEFSANTDYEFNTTVGTYTAIITTPTDVVVDGTMRPPTPVTRAAQLEFLVAAGRGRVEYDEWNALTAIDAQSLPAGGLEDGNSLSFTVGSIIYRVAKATNVTGAMTTADEYFAYGASSAGSYDLTVNYVQLALEGYADRNVPTEVVPLTRQERELPAIGTPGQVLTVAPGATSLEYATPITQGTGTGDDTKLIRFTVLPAIAGYNVGDIINLNGELNELVANTEDSNVYRGTANASPPITFPEAQTDIDFIWRVESSATWAAASSTDRLPASGNFVGGASDGLFIGVPAGSTNLVYYLNNAQPSLTQQAQTGVTFNGVDYDVYRYSTSTNQLAGLVGTWAFDATVPTLLGASFVGDDTFAFEGTTPYGQELRLLKTSVTTQPATLYVEFVASDGQTAELTLGRAAGSDSTDRYAWTRSAGGVAVETVAAGSTFTLTFYTDEVRSTAFTVHSANRWEADSRDAAVSQIALVGNTDRWPKTKLPTDTAYGEQIQQTLGIIAEDTTYDGFTLLRTDTSVTGTAAVGLFSPVLDLDDHPHGEFHAELDLTLSGATDVNMSFELGSANATAEQRNLVLSNIVFASNLAEEGEWVQGTPEQNASTLFEVPLYSANTVLGHYYMRLAHDDNNQAGIVYHYVGISGGTGCTLTAELRVSFTPTDASIANRNARGALQATTGILPTTITTGASITSSVLNWSLASGSAFTLDGGLPKPPLMRPAPNVIGYWFVFKRGGVEYSEAMRPFGQQETYRLELQANPGARDDAFLMSYTQEGRVDFVGAKQFTIPANSTLEIYLAVN